MVTLIGKRILVLKHRHYILLLHRERLLARERIMIIQQGLAEVTRCEAFLGKDGIRIELILLLIHLLES